MATLKAHSIPIGKHYFICSTNWAFVNNKTFSLICLGNQSDFWVLWKSLIVYKHSVCRAAAVDRDATGWSSDPTINQSQSSNCVLKNKACFRHVNDCPPTPPVVTENVGWASDMIRDWERDEAAKAELRTAKAGYIFGPILTQFTFIDIKMILPFVGSVLVV